MRASTILSLVVAVILAIMAVFGARTWLIAQRAQLAEGQGSTQIAPLNKIVVAKTAMRFGERLTAEKLDLIDWASSALPPGAYGTIEELAGATDETARFALSSMEKGEPVLQSKITSPGQRAKLSTAISPGMKAVSIRVNDVLGVSGFVLPGDRVDVMLTRTPTNKDDDSFVDVLLQGVKVLAIDQSVDDRKDQPSVVSTVTFEVSTDEAQKLMLGAAVGTLSLALRNVVSAEVEPNERVTVADIADGGLASSLAKQVAEQEAQAQEQRIQEQLDRLSALETTLKTIGSDVTGRLETVEQNLNNPSEPVVLEKEVIVEKVVEVERIVEVPAPPPAVITVGVVRNGQRVEYRVGTNTPAGE